MAFVRGEIFGKTSVNGKAAFLIINALVEASLHAEFAGEAVYDALRGYRFSFLEARNVFTHVRDDAIQLFGFLTPREKEAFLLLMSVSGIGPKLALSVISALNVDDLVAAIRNDDHRTLASVPGIGKKSAGRLALELKDKVDKLASPGDLQAVKATEPANQLLDDALSALVNLGYKASDVREMVKQVLASRNGDPPLQDLVRAALKELAK